jgi:hypothetical protein
MPTITRLSNCTINLYADDHPPPHFHVRMGDGRQALVAIIGQAVLRGNIPARELVEPIAWASANVEYLML